MEVKADPHSSAIELQNFPVVRKREVKPEDLLSRALLVDAPPEKLLPLIHLCKKVNFFTDGCTPLHRVCQRSDHSALQALLKKGANVHLTSKEGYTALHYAALNGFANGCLTLISCGANVNARTKRGYTPMHFAAGKADAFFTLADLGGGPFELNNEGQTPFYYAVKYGSIKVVRYYLSMGLHPDEPFPGPEYMCSRYMETPRETATNPEVKRLFEERHPTLTGLVCKQIKKLF